MEPTNMHEAVDQRLVDIQDEVRDAFGWGLEEDLLAAEALVQRTYELVAAVPSWSQEGRLASLDALRATLFAAERVTVLGAAATEEEARRVAQQEGVIIAADGSVGALRVRNRLACVVSDFDGGVHLHSAAKEGVPIVAHSHGDNVQRFTRALSEWSQFDTPPSLILTHQTPAQCQGAHNFGGFTDGDRAVCFALAMGVNLMNIDLVGFSLNTVGMWSATTVPEQKLKKLAWMYRILEMVELHDAVAP